MDFILVKRRNLKTTNFCNKNLYRFPFFSLFAFNLHHSLLAMFLEFLKVFHQAIQKTLDDVLSFVKIGKKLVRKNRIKKKSSWPKVICRELKRKQSMRKNEKSLIQFFLLNFINFFFIFFSKDLEDVHFFFKG